MNYCNFHTNMCHPFDLTIPSAFSDSLSYSEMICKLLDYIKKLKEYIENNKLTITNEVKAYIDNQIQTVMSIINCNDFKYNEEFAAIKTALASYVTELRNYVDSKTDETKAYVNNEIKNTFDIISNNPNQQIVLSPIFKVLQPLQDCLNDLYEYLRDGVTCLQWNLASLTAEEYDNLNITAIGFATNSKWIFLYYQHRVFSGFTGERIRYQDAFNEIVGYLKTNALTAQEYKNLDITAQQYIDYSVTAYDYGWNGKTILGG